MHADVESLQLLASKGDTSLRGMEAGGMMLLAYRVGAGTDMRPLMQGLPGDLCSCPHWGYVVRGRVRIMHADHEEVVTAGEVFHVEAGHAPVFEEDTEMIEVSPREPWLTMMQTVGRNLAAMATA